MSHLQLAEGTTMLDNYIRVPAHYSNTGETQYIREDYFDDLPDSTYHQVMGVLDSEQLSEGIYLQDKAARQARRAERQKRKAGKRAMKDRRVEARTAKKEAKALYKGKQAAGEVGFEKGKGLKAVMDTVGNVAGSLIGGGQKQLTYDVGFDQESGLTYEAGLRGDTAQWIRGVPNWAVMVGGVALIGGTIFLVTRKK